MERFLIEPKQTAARADLHDPASDARVVAPHIGLEKIVDAGWCFLVLDDVDGLSVEPHFFAELHLFLGMFASCTGFEADKRAADNCSVNSTRGKGRGQARRYDRPDLTLAVFILERLNCAHAVQLL